MAGLLVYGPFVSIWAALLGGYAFLAFTAAREGK
jgi:hypothetical protein